MLSDSAMISCISPVSQLPKKKAMSLHFQHTGNSPFITAIGTVVT